MTEHGAESRADHGEHGGRGQQGPARQRDERGRFVRGNTLGFQPGNDLWRRREPFSLTRFLRRLIEENDARLGRALVQRGLKEAIDHGDYRFWYALFERLEGRPLQRVEGHFRHDVAGVAFVQRVAQLVVKYLPPDRLAQFERDCAALLERAGGEGREDGHDGRVD